MTYHAEHVRAFSAAAAMPPRLLRAIQGAVSVALQAGDGLPEFRDRLQLALDATTEGLREPSRRTS